MWLLLACLAAACAPPGDPVHRAQFAALGTIVSVQIHGVPDDRAAAAVAQLVEHYRLRGKDWYPWADGELARANAAFAEGETAVVSDALRALLQRATDIERLSGGRFNAALGGLTELWRFHDPLAADWQPPSEQAIERFTPPPSLTALAWDGRSVRSTDPRVTVDPGGIAKGALLAESVALLRQSGIADAIVDIGGDLVVLGTPGERPARIGIRRPGGHDALGWIEVRDGEAVVTSGNYERFFEYDGRRYAHVLDPASGRPAGNVASVTVIDADAVLADAAATALLVGGAGAFDELCAALGIGDALLVGAGGDLRLTPGMQSRVHWLPRD